MKKDVPCKDNLHDCKAYIDGYCKALWNTDFKRQCPFYKKKKETER